MRRALPIVLAGALATAAIGTASESPATHPSVRTSPPLPAGATVVAVAFVQGLLSLQAGDTAAITVIEHTAAPDLARFLLAEVARAPHPSIAAGVVTSVAAMATGPGRVAVLVQARVRVSGATEPLALTWPLAVRRVAGRWVVVGLAGRWDG